MLCLYLISDKHYCAFCAEHFFLEMNDNNTLEEYCRSVPLKIVDLSVAICPSCNKKVLRRENFNADDRIKLLCRKFAE
jgi:hypothetical protein